MRGGQHDLRKAGNVMKFLAKLRHDGFWNDFTSWRCLTIIDRFMGVDAESVALPPDRPEWLAPFGSRQGASHASKPCVSADHKAEYFKQPGRRRHPGHSWSSDSGASSQFTRDHRLRWRPAGRLLPARGGTSVPVEDDGGRRAAGSL